MGTYIYEQVTVAGIDHTLRNEIAAFSEKIMGEEGPSYTSDRFSIYKEILLARKEKQMAALQYLYPFVYNNNYCCYLGPLLSSRGAFFPMFIYWLKKAWPEEGAAEIYLAAEFQNPDLFLFFKTIFCSYSYPQAGSQVVPEKICLITSLFTEHIHHIHEFNIQNLSTVCNESGYTKTTKNPVLHHWLESRKVKINKGQAQMLIVCLPGAEKKQVIESLEFYLNHPAAIKQKKNELLESLNTTI